MAAHDIHRLLQQNCDKLLSQYQANIDAVIELQNVLIDDVLPSLADELGLDSDATGWAKDWLSDTVAIFQILRRHHFTRSSAMEAIRKILAWRKDHLWPLVRHTVVEQIHCLPSDITDPLGRPILVLKPVVFDYRVQVHQPQAIRFVESLRLHLKSLNYTSNREAPYLQYVIVLDLANLSMRNVSVDLISWFMREVIPRCPGMLAAAFMINSSWAHTGIWNVAKRVLPDTALSRVFFCTQDELIGYFSPSSLPYDYGGQLDALCNLKDPLRPAQPQSVQSPPIIFERVHRHISPTSILNPFFGYPVHVTEGRPPFLQNGRRRKRDLVRTLTLLLWFRWRRGIMSCLYIIGFICAIRLVTLKRTWRSSRSLQLIRALSGSA